MNLLSKNFIDTHTNKLLIIMIVQSAVLLIFSLFSLVPEHYLLFHCIIKIILLTGLFSMIMLVLLLVILLIYFDNKYNF